ALSWLAAAGFDPAFGARPLKRVMQRMITNRLSEMILSGTVQEGDSVNVTTENGDIVLIKTGS
ncbi:MAG TPA: chaperone protein ClpB, partial [Prosthecochloris aestuarii]|nr:chaperone protein ClpB [Prosthecochloris aestuarii]